MTVGGRWKKKYFVMSLFFPTFAIYILSIKMAKNIIDNLIVIGDRVLIEPSMATKKTKGGLLLPAGYQEKE